MKKYKQREIKGFVAMGHAIDITNHDGYMQEQLETLEGKLDCIGYSHGVYGVNGLLLRGRYPHRHLVQQRWAVVLESLLHLRGRWGTIWIRAVIISNAVPGRLIPGGKESP